MGTCISSCFPPTPKMITIQKHNQPKTKEEIRIDLLNQLAYMKERIDGFKTEMDDRPKSMDDRPKRMNNKL